MEHIEESPLSPGVTENLRDDYRIVLASSSPRRRMLLEQIDIRFHQLHVDVSEERLVGESPDAYVIRLALAKARAGWDRSGASGVPVLGADTAVILGNDVLGKPMDRQHGIEMLKHLSDATHTVMTAVALVGYAGRSVGASPAPERKIVEATRLSVSHVAFRSMTSREQADYWDSGEPSGKAGGYAIQGRAAMYIRHIDGSYSGIVGLPLFETSEMLREFGII